MVLRRTGCGMSPCSGSTGTRSRRRVPTSSSTVRLRLQNTSADSTDGLPSRVRSVRSLSRARQWMTDWSTRFGRRRGGSHRDAGGPLQEALGDPPDLGRHGRGQHHRLPPHRQLRDDVLDVGDEAHVEHAVGFVDDEDFHADQQQRTAVEQVEEAPRGGDHDVDRLRRASDLGADVDAADKELRCQVHVRGEQVHVFLDLEGQFPHGLEDQGAGHPRPGAPTGKPVDHREREGGGLPGAGLRRGQDVPTLERQRDRRLLDRRRRCETGVADRPLDRLGEPELIERGDRAGPATQRSRPTACGARARM